VESTHMGLLTSRLVASQVRAFLRHGRFDAEGVAT
jgi:hypothetical protein